MVPFTIAVLRMAKFLWILVLAVLGAAAAGLMFAPELVWQLVLAAAACVCLIGGGCALVRRFRRKSCSAAEKQSRR